MTTAASLSLSPPYAAQPPPPEYYPYDSSIGITPSMVIIFSSIVGVFLLMGCLSVYARRCVDTGYDRGLRLPTRRRGNGIDPSVLETFPTFLYSEVKGLKIGSGSLECAVCLNEFDDMVTLRLLPRCCHVFHRDCVDEWLFCNITCPVCRAELVPVPDETNRFVIPVRESEGHDNDYNSYHTADDDIIIDLQSPEPVSNTKTPRRFFPPRSTSRKNRLLGKFKRSFTTGHVPVRTGEDFERFTLRLPEEVRNKLMSMSLNRIKSGEMLTRVRSKRKGFRSATVGATKGRTLLNYERFEPEGWFTRSPLVFSRSGSNQRDIGADIQHLANEPKSLLRSVGSQFNTFCGSGDGNIKEDISVGERSFDRLRLDGDDQV